MKKVFSFLCLCLGLNALEFNFAPKIASPDYEKKIVVCIPSYNNEDYCINNLHTVFTQKYENYHVIYVDDASTDKTLELVTNYIHNNKLEDKITIIHNDKNKGPMANWYFMVHQVDDDAIVVSLDGDDHLAHERVLQRVNEAYADDRVWVTYGNFLTFPCNIHSNCKEVTFSYLRNRKYRKDDFAWSHLRTFYAGLFKKIPAHRFKSGNGKFIPMASDVAIMFNLMDMAGDHVFCIPSVLYRYNRANVLNEDKINHIRQVKIAKYLARKKPLKRLRDWRN